MAERVKKTSNVLRESNLIGSVEKDLLDAISPRMHREGFFLSC